MGVPAERRVWGRIGRPALLLIAALLAHRSFCEWRTVEYDAAHAARFEGRVLWTVRRLDHPLGNAAAFDARKAELRVYHAAWLDCWEQEEGAGDSCRAERASGADATTRAVRVAECERRDALDVSRRPGFHRCLAARGHSDAPPPRWTRDDFGQRFPGSYWTLTALLAEDFGGTPATSRVAGSLLGVALPAALCLAAAASVRRGWSVPPPDSGDPDARGVA
jgi:hypothetical protein